MRAPRLLVAIVIIGLAAYSAGCAVETGLTQELVVDEPLGAAAVTDVELNMGAGDLTIAPGALGLASGTIRYNVESWEPIVTRTDTKLTIKQGSQKGVSGLGSEIVNKWDLELGRPPIRLKISAGAYEGSFDLSGLTLQDLSIKDGASRTQVRFSSPNPGQMTDFAYKTGASTVTLIGLANANFRSMIFDGGAGTYSLDFSGQLRTDASVRIEAAAGSVRIAVPKETAAQVTIDGTLNDVDAEGTWTVINRTYSTPAAGAQNQGKKLTIKVEIDVGSVTLVTR
ncbi:MAG: hypothetical protein JXA87_09775 [Thermoleophilia bacterium]|nr:hypothetical protein [Thermoleophilia bacterium]